MDGTALVVGAGRGLGRGIAIALAEAGASAIAVARTQSELIDLATDAEVQIEVADAALPSTAPRLLATYQPQLCILVAGAAPVSRPLQEHTWETFSVNWHTDVRMTFEWVREALLMPLRPGKPLPSPRLDTTWSQVRAREAQATAMSVFESPAVMWTTSTWASRRVSPSGSWPSRASGGTT